MTSQSTAVYLHHNNPLCLCITLQFHSLSVFTYILFFVTALLKYNSHAIKFTLKVCNHHHYLIPDIFITPKKKPYTHHFPFPSPHSLRQPLIYFLSLQICLFWTCHINGIIQYLFFCVWFISLSVLSGFIYVVVCVRILFLFMAE